MVQAYQAGQQLGPYELLQPLGSGGFAEVWLALETGRADFRRKVALKLLTGDADRRDAVRESLINEARVGGCLNHANIVDLYGIDEIAGTWLIAMEYVDGFTVSELLRQLGAAGLAMPFSVVLDIGHQIALGLHHAHSALDHSGAPLGLIHRDLKPSNVMVSRDGVVKVADFGIAKASTNVASTVGAQAKGTPMYMAPETWKGTRAFSPALDLFALGAVLWEMSVGRPLFAGSSAVELAGRIVHGDPTQEIAELALAFPPLAAVVLPMLDRDPARRPASAEAVALQIEALRGHVERPGDLRFFLGVLGRTPGAQRAPGIPVTEPRWQSLIARSDAGLGAGLEDTIDSTLGSLVPALAIPSTRPMDQPAHPGPPAVDAPWVDAVGPPPPAKRPTWPLPAALVSLAAAVLFLATRPAAVEPLTPTDDTVVSDSEASSAAEVIGAADPEPSPLGAAPASAPMPAEAPDPGRVAPTTPSAAPVVATTPSPAPVVDPTLRPAPVPDATPEPAPSPATTGCVVFRSRTPGEYVYVDGRKSPFRARWSAPPSREYPPGSIEVVMGQRDGDARVTVEVLAGRRHVVECELEVDGGCTVRSEAGGCE